MAGIMIGLDQIVDNLKKKVEESKADDGIHCVVGFTQSYAIFVHEIIGNNHPVGQAKFLEQPAREKSAEISEVVRAALAEGKTLSQALLLGGLRLQREAQLLCPVLTGALKASAFTRLEREGQ